MYGRVRHYVIILVLASTQFVRSQTTRPSQIQGKDVEVSLPPGWEYNQVLLQRGGPIALTNFRGEYLHGGLLPPKGAEIEITSVPRPIQLADYASSELRGVRQLKLQEIAINGRPTLRVSYVDDVADRISMENVVYYVPQGLRLYKFYMTFGSGDTHQRQLAQTLETIVRQAVLK